MSYPRDVEELTEEELWTEIFKRSELRQRKRCTYCERPADTAPCKFPERHAEAAGEDKKR